MEPQHNNFELPQPQEAVPGQSDETTAAQPEKQTVASSAPATAATTQPDPQPVVNSLLPQQPTTPAHQTYAGTHQMIADDADLIEKEWVTKAKSIVAQTKNDPYHQNQEMNKVKADYLKKRYNKDLKVSEG